MVNLLTASLKQIMQRIQILFIAALQRASGVSDKRCNELYIVLYSDTVFDIIFLDKLLFFSGFILTGHCKNSPSPSPYCPYLSFPLLPLFFNASHISWPPCSPSLRSPAFHTIFIFFILPFDIQDLRVYHHPIWNHSFCSVCYYLPTSIQYQKYHKCLPASLIPFSGILPQNAVCTQCIPCNLLLLSLMLFIQALEAHPVSALYSGSFCWQKMI